MILAIKTQYRENYGAHSWDGEGECPQYWKNKGGSTYLVDLLDKNASNVEIDELTNLINYKDEGSEEYVIGIRLEEDDYCSDYERSQKEEPYFSMEGVYYDTRIERREDGTYFATEQYKGPRGQWVATWNMAPGGKQENRQFTEEYYKTAS